MEGKAAAGMQAGVKKGFGTSAVYFTAISSILGAILFLRLGFATGTLGFWGVIFIILLGHLITIPTALAISELATNTRVEGGGEYFIMSRSFGLKIGSTIGITLFLSQAISIAFYTIAFAEAFQPLYDWWLGQFGWELPRQAVSVPTLLILASLMLMRGSGSGLKMLYAVNAVLLVSLVMFFMGNEVAPSAAAVEMLPQIPDMIVSPWESVAGYSSAPIESLAPAIQAAPQVQSPLDNFGFFNDNLFFIIFAICFPAFTGMTAGVGLSGNLRNPGRSIPVGTMAATITGLVVYCAVAWKFSVSATPADLVGDQLIMSRIALFGAVVIPLGLAACTSSSAIGAMMVAPRTLQAIARDRIFPFRRLNIFLARGKGKDYEPVNASVLTFLFALVFVVLGDVDTVAGIITMFFLITYGCLCLISFLHHFGSSPSYRPRFRSKWFISLVGFILSIWVMFKINSLYTVIAYAVIILIYLFVEYENKDKKGLVNIFKGAIFQLNRQLQVYMQKNRESLDKDEWRPAAVCISSHSFERPKVLDLMKWISYQHGFGTYFHFVEGYFSRQTHLESEQILANLIDCRKGEDCNRLYIDTMISPSYTSAIAQVIQAPSISGMENNMAVFEYDKGQPAELNRILENVNLVRAGDFDICIFAISKREIRTDKDIHVWIKDADEKNVNFMILLGFIILNHPDWKKSRIKIFITSPKSEMEQFKLELQDRIASGRLPITLTNIVIVPLSADTSLSGAVEKHSHDAGLTIIGFHDGIIKHDPVSFFTGFDGIGDILFVNSSQEKDII